MRFKHKRFLVKLWKVIYKTIFTFNIHGGIENAGYLSFSLLLAFFPFVIFFTSIVGWWGHSEFGIYFLNTLKDSLPTDVSNSIFPVIDNIMHTPVNILSLATLTLLWSASSIVQAIKGILDKAYRIRKTQTYLKGRTLSIIQFLVMLFFIFTIIVFNVVIPKFFAFLRIDYDISFARSVLLSLFLFVFVEFIFYTMSSKRKMKLKELVYGNLLVVVGWIVSGRVFSFYLYKFAKYNSVYGSFAGVIVSLLYFFIMSIIFIFGAEFNYNLRDFFKKKIR
ncbi:MAG: YihY/virulence factor BrkB family protein [Rickettsiales bacterium]|jgi:membrane protein|nr:YihY/virulence factor BrkB family protein [Rickettsiales bacterium]